MATSLSRRAADNEGMSESIFFDRGVFYFPDDPETIPLCEDFPKSEESDPKRWEGIGVGGKDYAENRDTADRYFVENYLVMFLEEYAPALCRTGASNEIYIDRSKKKELLSLQEPEGPRKRLRAQLLETLDAYAYFSKQRTHYLELEAAVEESDKEKKGRKYFWTSFGGTAIAGATAAAIEFGILTAMGGDAAMAAVRLFPKASLLSRQLAFITDMRLHPRQFTDLLDALKRRGMDQTALNQLVAGEKILCETPSGATSSSNRFGRLGERDRGKYAAFFRNLTQMCPSRKVLLSTSAIVFGGELLYQWPTLSNAWTTTPEPTQPSTPFSAAIAELDALLNDPEITDETLEQRELDIERMLRGYQTDIVSKTLSVELEIPGISRRYAQFILDGLDSETVEALGEEALAILVEEAEGKHNAHWLNDLHRTAPIALGGLAGLSMGFGAGAALAHSRIYNQSLRPDMSQAEANIRALDRAAYETALARLEQAYADGVLGLCDAPAVSPAVEAAIEAERKKLEIPREPSELSRVGDWIAIGASLCLIVFPWDFGFGDAVAIPVIAQKAAGIGLALGLSRASNGD